MKFNTDKFDSDFKKITHYKDDKFQEMLPWVGIHYGGEKFPKILFIGESHYLPKSSKINLKNWYELDRELTSDEKGHFNTRKVIGWHHSTNQIWNAPQKIMKQFNKILLNSSNVYEYFSFYNFYQRPAKNGKTIQPTAKDNRKANELLKENLKILNPDIVIFLSRKAHKGCLNSIKKDYKMLYTCHPSSRWWNRKAKAYALSKGESLTGGERFKKLIEPILTSKNL